MAEIVGAFGVPHTPFFPFFVERDGPECEIARNYAALRRHVEALKPDAIVIFDTDHLNTFFFDNLPVFSIGVAESFQGPNDEVRAMKVHNVKSLPALARHIRKTVVRSGFDVGETQKFTVDHSVMVPMHFLNPDMQIPVIPLFVSGHLPPLPSAKRCHELGRAVRQAIRSWPEQLRVVTMGSGSFSLEVWGPRIEPGKADGVPDLAWAERVCALLKKGDFDTLINEATPEQMAKAGNVGGELLDWIVMLGTVNAKPAESITLEAERGHAYAVWR